MKTIPAQPRCSVASGVLVGVLMLTSVCLILNGLFMLAGPRPWYDQVPGVNLTGGFNAHFIRDIGIIQAFLGGAFIVGLLRPAVRLELWGVASAWLVAHATLHFWEVAVGICAPSAIPRDFPAVTLPALVGCAATTWAWRRRRTTQ